MSAVTPVRPENVFKTTSCQRQGGRGHLRQQVCQLVFHLPAWRSLCGSVPLLSVYAPTVHHCPSSRSDAQRRPSILSEGGHRARPPSSRRSGEVVSVRGGGPRRGAESGGDTARAGADGGQRLLAAVQEGRVVGALLAAVVVVRLPALTLPLPATAKDPNERLKTHRH